MFKTCGEWNTFGHLYSDRSVITRLCRSYSPGLVYFDRIQMTNMRDRNEVIKQKKNLRGSNIYIDQDLTASELKNSKALRKYRGEVLQQGKKAFFKRGQLQVEGKLYGAVNGIITEVQGY